MQNWRNSVSPGYSHVVVDTPSSHQLRVRPHLRHNPITASTRCVFIGPTTYGMHAKSTWIIQTHQRDHSGSLPNAQQLMDLHLVEHVPGARGQHRIPSHETYLSTTILSQR